MLRTSNLKFGEMEFGEMKRSKHFELEQFLHASASRGFVSVSWVFLLNIHETFQAHTKLLRYCHVNCLLLQMRDSVCFTPQANTTVNSVVLITKQKNHSMTISGKQ